VAFVWSVRNYLSRVSRDKLRLAIVDLKSLRAGVLMHRFDCTLKVKIVLIT